jgi:hypothetical protein
MFDISVIPSLSDSNALYKVTASSEFNSDFAVWKCCNIEVNNEWATKGETNNYWLTYEHPFEIKVGSFSLSGRLSESPLQWRLEGFDKSKNVWDILYIAVNAPLDLSFQKYLIDSNNVKPYAKFRFFVTSSTSNSLNPGLSHFQLYI